jgi:hypothetical protein
MVRQRVAKVAAEALGSSAVVQVTNNWSVFHTANTPLFESVRALLTVPRKIYKPSGSLEQRKVTFIHKKGRFGTGLYITIC